jgi:sporulation-control protein spo0M
VNFGLSLRLLVKFEDKYGAHFQSIVAESLVELEVVGELLQVQLDIVAEVDASLLALSGYLQRLIYCVP